MESGKLKSAADRVVQRPVGREEARDWAALALPLQVCLDKEVIQDSDWPDTFCHCQNMRRGNMACAGYVMECGSSHLGAGNLARSRFEAVLCIACAFRSHPLHSSENTPPTHSKGPIHLLSPPLLSVGGVDQSPVINREGDRGNNVKTSFRFRTQLCVDRGY